MNKETQGFVTHRCGEKPDGMSLRKYDKDSVFVKGGVWVLGEHRSDWDWDYEWLANVCSVRFCPWCGEELK